ncbi:alpha/beta hydrolase [Acidicapsa dinghuensis]|uniref:Alpha/beta hydrolase n=1 Tax=Acidicapsa dinghuensis TaxID=2218256 RepID=A0ABW1E9G3_9BACT|nr:alpha/beta hydrolase [Acidicapsa dinghuensis]
MARKPLLALAAAAAFFAITSYAQKPAWQPAPGHKEVRLWPGAAPDGPVTSGSEVDTTGPGNNNLIAGKPLIRLGNVNDPTMTLYAPKGKNTGAAVVVFPGGGYRILAIDLEGTEVCAWLNAEGVSCILVKYRVPGTDQKFAATGPYPKSKAALEDAQRAVGLVRSHAAEWHIDPNRIGVLGFSAGGHLSVALSTHYDKRLYTPIDAADQLSCKPNFAVVIYPGYLADTEHSMLDELDIHPDANNPPTILVQAENDPVHVENVTTYFLALKQAKVPAELHIYTEGGHGYGLRPQANWPVTAWPHLVDKWLHTIHMLGAVQP